MKQKTWKVDPDESAAAILRGYEAGRRAGLQEAARAVERVDLPAGGSRCEERVIILAAKVIRALADPEKGKGETT